jgi:hypothetical protein
MSTAHLRREIQKLARQVEAIVKAQGDFSTGATPGADCVDGPAVIPTPHKGRRVRAAQDAGCKAGKAPRAAASTRKGRPGHPKRPAE